jgi:hypothetical protein
MTNLFRIFFPTRIARFLSNLSNVLWLLFIIGLQLHHEAMPLK